MSNDSHPIPLFEDAPQVELLQWLARGSLKQNLLRSIRLWVWLQSLYGHHRLDLPASFTYTDWRDAFFSSTHPKGESSPTLHDPDCACAKPTAGWLFTAQTGLLAPEWKQLLQQQTGASPATIEDWLQKRLFAVTRRSLFADLQVLAELGWLTMTAQGYALVFRLPTRPSAPETMEPLELLELGFLNPQLETIAESLAHPIAEVQRFYLEVDYIVSQSQRRLEGWLEQLKALWQVHPVQPIRLHYQSAKFGITICIIYPVCLYYAQRAVYLCGFGETPLKGHWYHYRLDKITQMEPLAWNDRSIPKILRQRRTTLPTPEYIREQMRSAWGFDFYLPAQLMLLRFEQSFHDRYIQGTFRHHTFARLSYAEVTQMIHQWAGAEQQALLKIIQQRSDQDAYYRVNYRMGDTNVGLRLRAWRPKLEVLLPWELRQQMIREIELERSFYQD
ncbi:MAG: TIGR03985 family CRISPR-associated protein [Elainella sp. Prado103]|jgi:CRISPR-associated protein (TIGR03985 family)|nr:TIGR03985 family CRISPR-associated protein [Elainella sp. Prado103]